VEESLNGPAPDASRLDGLARWLVDEAPHHSVEDLFAEFCREVVRRGLPVYQIGRASCRERVSDIV
jgi:hypothetical protein